MPGYYRIATLVSLAIGLLAFPAQAQDTVFINDKEAIEWRASWIAHPDAAPDEAGMFYFRRTFDLESVPESLPVHVSGDNRFRLYVNGTFVAGGPARSDPAHWRYQTVDIAGQLRSGRNVVSAMVWNWGTARPVAQMSLRTGFLLQAQSDNRLDTGPSWQVLWNKGWRYEPVDMAELGTFYVASPSEIIEGAAIPWNWQEADDPDPRWMNAVPVNLVTAGSATAAARGSNEYGVSSSWQLVPREIPPMEESTVRFAEVERTEGILADDAFIRGSGDLRIPAGSQISLLLDHGALTSAYPVLISSGGKGAKATLTYAESLIDAAGDKGDRDVVAGKAIKGFSDRLIFDGGGRREYRTAWWRTYRYVQLDVRTADEPLIIHEMHGIFTAYPFELTANFASDREWMEDIWKVNWRSLRLSAFETFMDTPYYEQLQYVGDTRLESLMSLYNSGDDRLMRNAIELFDQSRIPEGLTASRYPSSEPQYIPPFSLWWIAMVHDYYMHRDDPDFIRKFVPGTRGVIAWFESHLSDSGMLGPMPWWGFLDWNPAYDKGAAPGAREGGSTAITLQFSYALQQAAELEDHFGQPAEAARYRQLSASLNEAIHRSTWDSKRKLFADTPAKRSFSQHANSLAVLAGAVPAAKQRELMERVLDDESLLQATYYFRFYVDEAMREAGLADRYLERLTPWREMIARGLTTTPEAPDPSRSDSHAWSAHPNYHMLATVLGVRPASPGFKSVEIAPAIQGFGHVSGTVPHPAGMIEVDLVPLERSVRAHITLPSGVTGVFRYGMAIEALRPGTQVIEVSAEQ